MPWLPVAEIPCPEVLEPYTEVLLCPLLDLSEEILLCAWLIFCVLDLVLKVKSDFPYLHRVAPNKNTSANIEAVYNEKGQMLDANTKEVLIRGQIDKGHKHGYEEQAMRKALSRIYILGLR